MVIRGMSNLGRRDSEGNSVQIWTKKMGLGGSRDFGSFSRDQNGKTMQRKVA